MPKTKTKIKITNSNHLIIECLVNDVKGKFILDSGASNSCIDLKIAKKFNLNIEESDEKASSATNMIKHMFISRGNKLDINNLVKKDFEIILFDMSQINNSFREKGLESIDGLVGGDILVEFKGVVSYESKTLILNT